MAIADAAPWFEHAGGRRSSAPAFSALLLSYADTAGIDRAIARTAARLRQPQPLVDAGRAWSAQLPQLRATLPILLDGLLAVAASPLHSRDG